MMKITNERIQGAGGPRKAARTLAAAPGFAGLIDKAPSADAAKESAATVAATPIVALLSAQEMPTGMAERKRGTRRGKDLLEHLDHLRLALISGTYPRQRLANLVTMLAQDSKAVADPDLAAVLAEIELRAHVELAKYDQSR